MNCVARLYVNIFLLICWVSITSIFIFWRRLTFKAILFQVHLESEEEVAKRTAGDVAPVGSDNEMAFVALLANAGFTIRSDTNARFTKSGSDCGQEDRFDNGSIGDEDEDYDLVLEVEKNSGVGETKVHAGNF